MKTDICRVIKKIPSKSVEFLTCLTYPLVYTISKHIPDEMYLKHRYKRIMGKKLNLHPPMTYNEKLNWIKIYDKDPIYTKLADKYQVREYVSEKIGDEYIIPILGVWDRYEDIDFNTLPEQFVLKCTHDSESVVICTDKSTFNFEQAKEKLTKALKINFYYYSREWAYKNIKPRIIAEKYMATGLSDLPDYKFFCFDGKVVCLYTMVNYTFHHKEGKLGFFDRDYNLLPFHRRDFAPITEQLPKPQNYDKMVEIAEILSAGFPHVRVDLYNINGAIYFGEMTFYNSGGYTQFEPEEWDLKLGEHFKIKGSING